MIFLLNNLLHLDLTTIVARILVLLTSLSFHELAHAYVADKLGDNTARNMGRITMNPLAHLDPVGTIMILLVGFGWAKPVQVDSRNFKNQRKGMAAVALAGPLANFLLAFITLVLGKTVWWIAILNNSAGTIVQNIISILYSMSFTNIALGVFNLIPVPPLDGSKVLGAFFSNDFYFKMMHYSQYSYIFLGILYITGLASTIVSFFSNIIFNGFDVLSGFVDIIFRMFI